MEKIAYESVNIITPFKLITFSLRNNILLQPQPEDLNKMYFFDQVIYIYIYIYIGLEIHFITFCYYLDLHSIKVDIHTHTHTHTHIYIYIYVCIYTYILYIYTHTLAVELLYNMYYFLFDCYE